MKKGISFLFTLLVILSSCQQGSEGELIYTKNCGNCHMDNGSGVAHLVPAFDVIYFKDKRSEAICHVIYGVRDTTGDMVMPSYPNLINSQIANVLNFINEFKGFQSKFFIESEIEIARQECDTAK